MSEYAVIGKPLPRIDAAVKATGVARYAGDYTFPRMLHGKILRSPYPHARILSIDTSKAEQLQGVKAVITGKDIPDQKYGIVPFASDEYGLAKEKVRYVGDEVAAVAAVDEDTALEALDLIAVEYELLPAVFTTSAAMADNAPEIHAGIKNNISAQIHKEWGDVEKAFAECDCIYEDEYVTQAVGHAPLEPHVSIADYDPSGKLTTCSSTQIPFYLRRNLSKTLELPESKVRVIKPYVGGGFGGKLDMFAHDFCGAFLSRRLGRPVLINYEREESLAATRGRHPMRVYLKTGVKSDGTILAQHYRVVADGGAYNSTAPLVITLSAVFSMIPYYVPNIRYDGYHVYTNKPANGAMRGHGIPQVRFASEAQMEDIAALIGMDAVDLRIKNAILPNEPHPGGLTIRSCGFTECLQKAREASGWMEKRQAKQVVNGKLKGIGMGCSAFPCGANNMSSSSTGAMIKIERDGAVTVLSGAADIGQGSDSVLAMIAAEELGVSTEDIRITSADTELTPVDPGTFGSGVTFRAGNAVKAAAADAKQKIFAIVSEKLEVSPTDLEAREGRIFVKGSPDKGMTFLDAVKACQYSSKPFPIVGEGNYRMPSKEPTTLLKEMGDFSGAYSFGAQTAEVEIDVETGHVKVIKVITAHDCGRAINPVAVEGQLEGSVVCGMGQVICEDFLWEQGSTMNPTFMDYKLPTTMDIPEIVSIEVETNDPLGPFGAKEAGEGSLVFTIPAVANAISNALGVRVKQLPITPDRVLELLRKQQAGNL